MKMLSKGDVGHVLWAIEKEKKGSDQRNTHGIAFMSFCVYLIDGLRNEALKKN